MEPAPPTRSGAPLQTVTTESVAATPAGGAWNPSGLILFAGRRSGLFSVPAAGGRVTPVTALDASAQEFAHRWPQFLPDGRHFLYLVITRDHARQGVYVGALDSTVKTRLLESEFAAVYAEPGYLFFERQGMLIAQPFDATRLRLSDGPPLIGGAVSPARSVPNGLPFSPSNNGIVVYTSQRSSEQAHMVQPFRRAFGIACRSNRAPQSQAVTRRQMVGCHGRPVGAERNLALRPGARR